MVTMVLKSPDASQATFPPREPFNSVLEAKMGARLSVGPSLPPSLTPSVGHKRWAYMSAGLKNYNVYTVTRWQNNVLQSQLNQWYQRVHGCVLASSCKRFSVFGLYRLRSFYNSNVNHLKCHVTDFYQNRFSIIKHFKRVKFRCQILDVISLIPRL